MNILKYRFVYYLISLTFIIAGLGTLLLHGLKAGIDFTGGSVTELRIVPSANMFEDIASSQVIETIQPALSVRDVTYLGDNHFIIRSDSITNQQKEEVITKLAVLGEVEELRFETVGPVLSAELLYKTIWSVLLASIAITIYIWRQFKNILFGMCAILAMLHDVLLVLGVFSILGVLFGVEVDVLFVTALLTTLAFSVHDTIVMYDRIRELQKRHPTTSFIEVANSAVLQTLARSFNTSFTIIIMLASLALLGGESIRWFVVALLVGSIAGTYSSPFVSVPLLYEFQKRFGGRV